MTDQISTVKTRSVCVGRFLIDVPADAEISYRPAFFSGWDVATDVDESDTDFAQRLSAREAQLRSEKNERGLISLEAVTPVNTEESSGKIFTFGREWTHGFENGTRVDYTFANTHAYIRSNHVTFNFQREIADKKDLPEIVSLAERVRARDAEEIPLQPGFCFERGIVVDAGNSQRFEGVTMAVELKGHPDVSIVLSMRAGITEPSTLLDRDKSAKESFSATDRARFSRWRAGPRSLAGIAGQELVEKVAEHNGTTGHSFMWESLHNDKTNPLTPFLTFEMSTGHGIAGAPVSSTLSDNAAIALWDRMANSLRVRQVRTAVSVARTATASEIGAVRARGDVCPQSGWWRCNDGSDRTSVIGGRLQFLRAGEAVPQATLLLPAAPWQRVFGKQRSFTSETPSRWQLVDRRKSPRLAPSAALAKAEEPARQLHPKVIDEPYADPLFSQNDLQVGTQLASGATCTVSGWWRCLERETLDGTRWFPAGAVLPEATRPLTSTLAQKMTGRPAHVRVPTLWQLIRLASSKET